MDGSSDTERNTTLAFNDRHNVEVIAGRTAALDNRNASRKIKEILAAAGYSRAYLTAMYNEIWDERARRRVASK